MTESLPNSVLSAIAARLEPAQGARFDDPQPMAAGGYSRNPLFRIRAHWDAGGNESQASYIVKKPALSPVTFVFGGDPELEARLFEHGVIQAVNRITGIHAPLVAVVRDAGAVWLIMEDVSADLAAWQGSMSVPPHFEAEKVLIDRLARLHVTWEGSQASALMDQVCGAVDSAQRARWCEPGYRAWLAGDAPPVDGNEASQRGWDSAQWAREPVLAFLIGCRSRNASIGRDT
jgi:hypothetical protein